MSNRANGSVAQEAQATPAAESESFGGRFGAREAMAAYIDLNAVRAGIVSDPKDYRWSGYGEAVAGKQRAREGLAAVLGDEQPGSWRSVASRYRLMDYAAGEERGLDAAGRPLRSGLSAEQVGRVVKERGELPLRQVLRCRVRYFSDGVAIGGKEFVNGANG